jgi:hypothetical protein
MTALIAYALVVLSLLNVAVFYLNIWFYREAKRLKQEAERFPSWSQVAAKDSTGSSHLTLLPDLKPKKESSRGLRRYSSGLWEGPWSGPRI